MQIDLKKKKKEISGLERKGEGKGVSKETCGYN